MRIQSNYRDYYDSIQKYVYGDSTTYVRAWCEFHPQNAIEVQDAGYHWRNVIIGFCGNVYSFLRYVREVNETIQVRGRDQVRTKIVYDNVWSVEEMSDLLKERKALLTLNAEEQRRFQKFFYVKKDDTIFIQQNAPIFVVTPQSKVCCPLNPVHHIPFNYSLKDFQFDKIVDDKEAYSKLVDYIAFLGMEHKDIPQMSNDNKIESHGFDKKSFRKKRIG